MSKQLARPLVFLLALTLPLLAAARPASAPKAPPAGELLAHMEGLKEHLKGVAMGLQAEDEAAVLEHVAEMQRLVLLAKLTTPPNLDQQPEKKRAAHRTAFRRDLALLLEDLVGLELDVLDGKPRKAFKRVTGSLFKLREAAHERYQRAD